MNPTAVQILGTVLFFIAVIHTFCVNAIVGYANKIEEKHGHTMFVSLLHFLGEVEAVFGIWSLVFIIGFSLIGGYGGENGALHYLENDVNYTEPAFIFVIMCMAGTKPILKLSESVIRAVAHILPCGEKKAFYISALILGPLLGSFITEPAAMTVTSLLLLQYFYQHNMSKKFMYATIGALFVNVSVGGTLTHFAAPPVLMVAGKWGWGMQHMLMHFGYKAAIGIVITTLLASFIFRKELEGKLEGEVAPVSGQKETCWWVTLAHIIFIALVVLNSHHMTFFLALFLFFLGFCSITKQYQDTLKIKDSLMVGFFLAGLVTLGGQQAWWLQVVLTKLPDLAMYFGATALTAVTDNAALTYLGSLVEGLSSSAEYYLVAGAVTGGGLTVIANAPNPAGFGILKGSFKGGVNPLYLFFGALVPTVIMIVMFIFLPSIGA